MFKKLAKKLARKVYHKLSGRDGRDADELGARFDADLGDLKIWMGGLDRATGEIKSEAHLFRTGSTALDTYEGRAQLWRRWQSLLDYIMAIDRVKVTHAGFAALDDDTARARSFLVAYTAFLAQYQAGYRWIRRVGRNKRVATLLDEKVPEFGIEAGLYDRLKWNVLHVVDIARVAAGRAYFQYVRDRLASPDWLVGFLAKADKEIRRALKARAVTDLTGNALAILKRKAFTAWFPVQKALSLAIGHTLVRDPEPLITDVHLDSLRPRLQPGDIFLVRRSWKLSNIGLPGYWPHAALYVGTPKVMRDFFKGDEGVRDWCRAQSAGVDEFLEFLRVKYTGRWAEFTSKPFEVIEAVSPTVCFHTLVQCCRADQTAVMRPRVPKSAIARAISLAFHYHGRPYDFDFDFNTDETLVCSEVVYKAYEGAVKFPLVTVAGRMTLPPNEMCAQFARERGTPRQQLDFVDFLDGRSDLGHVVHGTVDDYCASHSRSKWQFVTQG